MRISASWTNAPNKSRITYHDKGETRESRIVKGLARCTKVIGSVPAYLLVFTEKVRASESALAEKLALKDVETAVP